MKWNDRPTIAIRADGNEVLGMGHLMRCISIGKSLEKHGVRCVFIVAQKQAGAFIKEKGFACEVLDTDYMDMESELPYLYKWAEENVPRLWLVDSYQITQEYLRKLQRICPVFYLDDTGEQVFEAAGLINYNIYGDKLSYEVKCSRKMKLLLGVGYAPVKEEFVQTSYRIRKEVQNVLITMGGSDKLNITGKISQCLLEKLPERVKITLICGRFNPHLEELLKLQKAETRIRVLVDVPDMWNKMAEADLVVTAAGSTMYELSAMGVPTVSCYYVENQRRIAESFSTEVGICNVGDYSENPEKVLKRITDEVCKLVSERVAREELSQRMKQVVDGHGAERMACELLNVIEDRNS